MNHKTLLISLLLIAGAVGCKDKPVNTSERAEPLSTPTPLEDKRIVYDQHLRDIASVTGIRQATVSGDLLKIQVQITNLRSSSARFNYIFEWYDPQGMLIETPLSTWQPQTIEGRETISLTAIAPNSRAKDFKLKLQQSKMR